MSEGRPDEPVAAPPDAGGHLGAPTTPDALLTRPNENTPAQAPHLHRVDPDRPHPGRSPAAVWTVVALSVAGVVVLLAVLLAI